MGDKKIFVYKGRRKKEEITKKKLIVEDNEFWEKTLCHGKNGKMNESVILNNSRKMRNIFHLIGYTQSL